MNKNTRAAVAAHTNLNVFGAIVAILECGSIYGANPAAQKIIAICHKEQARQLAKYDAAIAAQSKEGGAA